MKRKRSLPATGPHGKGERRQLQGSERVYCIAVTRDIGRASYERGEASSVSEILESKTRRVGTGSLSRKQKEEPGKKESPGK